MCLLTQHFKPACWSLSYGRINSLHEALAIPRCRRGPFPRPVRILFYGAYVSHRVCSPGRPRYCCIDTESNRGDGFNVSHKSLRVSSRWPQDPFHSAGQATRMTRKCVWAPNPTRVLDDSPRALGDCRGPMYKKSPSATLWRRSYTYGAGAGPQQNGAVRVDSSQDKPARMRVIPKVVVSYPGWYQPSGSNGRVCLV